MGYLLIGVILLIGFIVTKRVGLDEETHMLFDKAMVIDGEMALWPGYRLRDYPIDVNYGDEAYRYVNGTITKQHSSLDVLALTAIREGGGSVIKTLSADTLRKVTDMAGDQTKAQRESDYLSILFHEGLHAYQHENGMERVMESFPIDQQVFEAQVAKLDGDMAYQRLWIEEMAAMKDFLETGNADGWKKVHDQRMGYINKVLGEEALYYTNGEARQELIEGTARYVEEKARALIGGEQQGGDEGIYEKGVEKFYTSGALKAKVLDRGEEWKVGLFESGRSLTALLIEDRIEK